MDDSASHAEDEDEDMHTGEEGEEDQEEWGGLEAAGNDSEGGTHPGKKPKKPPTGEELRNIKDASELYRSSSFKLQVRQLLCSVVTNALSDTDVL